MGGKQYQKGAAFENKVKHDMEAEGYLVTRSAKSHGPWDLMCWCAESSCVLIQCKTNGKISRADKAYLVDLAERNKCRVLLAYKDSKGHTEYMNISEVDWYEDG